MTADDTSREAAYQIAGDARLTLSAGLAISQTCNVSPPLNASCPAYSKSGYRSWTVMLEPSAFADSALVC